MQSQEVALTGNLTQAFLGWESGLELHIFLHPFFLLDLYFPPLLEKESSNLLPRVRTYPFSIVGRTSKKFFFYKKTNPGAINSYYSYYSYHLLLLGLMAYDSEWSRDNRAPVLVHNLGSLGDPLLTHASGALARPGEEERYRWELPQSMRWRYAVGGGKC